MEYKTVETQTIKYYNMEHKCTQTDSEGKNLEDRVIREEATLIEDKIMTSKYKFYQPNEFNWYGEAKATQIKTERKNKNTQTPQGINWQKRQKVSKRKLEEEEENKRKMKKREYVLSNREDLEVDIKDFNVWIKHIQE